MYSTILCFLLAVTIHALAPQNPEATWSYSTAAMMALISAASWAFIRRNMRKLTLSALADGIVAQRLRPRFTNIIHHHQALLLFPFALFTYATDYNSLVVFQASRASQALGGLFGLLPYLLMWAVLWWEAYPLKSVLFGPGDTRAGFVKSHARMEAAVIAPWFALLAIGDAGSFLWPGASEYLDRHPLAQLFYAPLFLTLAAVFMPLMVKRIWGCAPLPPGPLRERIEASVKRMGLNVREILFWPLLGGRLITAGIIGPIPRFRYLLLTPALASILDQEELEGVIAHEAGHIRYHHLWFYLFFFSGILVGGLAVFFQFSTVALLWWLSAFPDLAEARWAEPMISAALTFGMGVVLFISFRVLFGRLSRAFERQADLFALEAIGRQGPITSALESISLNTGDMRDLPSWHHGSIADRVKFISLAATDPTVGRAHHRGVSRTKKLVTVVILLLFASAVALEIQAVNRSLRQWAVESGLEWRVKSHPGDWRNWYNLGVARHGAGKEREALDAYKAAISINPGEFNSLNNSAWILATTKDPALSDPARAVELADRAAMLMPAPYILDTLSQALYKAGDREGALKALDMAIGALKEGDPEASKYLEKRKQLTEKGANGEK